MIFFSQKNSPGTKTNWEETMKAHLTFYHGTEGKPVACEVCATEFASENRLRVHRLNHEIYYCSECRLEILGRNPHKAHMIKVHGSGLVCPVCSRIFFAKKELEVHKKQAHTKAYKT